MVNQELLDFIKKQLQLGLTKEKISSELLTGGWNPQDIEEGFKSISNTPIHDDSLINKKKHKSLKILLVILVVFLLAGGVSAYYFRSTLVKLPIIKDLFVDKNISPEMTDKLSDLQIKTMEDAGIDPESSFRDAVFPDGNSIFEWGCKNDREFIRKNYPDEDKKCTEAGFLKII